MRSFIFFIWSFIAALVVGCSAQVTDDIVVPSVDPELIVRVVGPADATVQVGEPEALFLEFTFESRHDLLRVSPLRFVLISPDVGPVADSQGELLFTGGTLTLGTPSKVVKGAALPDDHQIDLTFPQAVTVTPGAPEVHLVRMVVGNPGEPTLSEMLGKGYQLLMLSLEEGDVISYGPPPFTPPLPEGVALPVEKIDQPSIEGGIQTVQ